MRNRLRRKPPAPARRVAPHAEWLEPRLLYSADAGALLSAAVGPQVADERVLSANLEYAAPTAATPTADQVRAAFALTPLQFEADQGQLGEGVDFAASGVGYAVRLGGGQAELLFAGADQPVRLELVGAAAGTAEGENLLATRSNALVGQDASQWVTDIANYASVVYRDVYQGIDVRYHGTQGQLEYDFLVAAGADASQLQLRFHGTDAVAVDADGDLVLTVAGSDRTIRFHAPVSWQDGPGGREAVESRYALQADGSVRIVVGAYDTTRALVVDPVLAHASYFGEAGSESALGVAVGSDGSVYVTGQTTSTAGTFASRVGGGSDNNDIYVAKFNADLSTLLYATRVGGTGTEQGNAIAVDASGNVAVTGWTRSTDFVAAGSGAQGTKSGTQDAVLFKLNAAGNAVVFSTYFGSLGATDVGSAVAFDASGNVYAAGTVSANTFLDPLLFPLLGGTDNAFLNKYSASGTVLRQLQFGGSGVDSATGLALDAAGNVYMVGTTASSGVAMLGGAQGSRAGGTDAFLVKYDSGGTVRYATYIGAGNADVATGVAVDGNGLAYVIGQTDNPAGSGFATTAGAFGTVAFTHETGFLRIYDTTKTGAASLAYSSFIGGSRNAGGSLSATLTDDPTGIAVSNGRVAIAGTADTSNLPTTADAWGRTASASSGFVLVLDPSGNGSADMLYGSYYGTGLATGGIAWSGNKVYLVGSTATATNLATADGYKTTPGGGAEGVVAMFNGFSNTAPVLAGANDLPAQLEDAAAGSGTLVSDLVAGQVSDADADALAGIAVTAVDASKGTWQYTLDGTTWSTLATPGGGSALLLAADGQTRVRFLPQADANGSSTLTFRAWDRSSWTAGSVVAVSATGGITAFSSASATASVAVLPVNDAPVRNGTLGTLTATEGGEVTLQDLSGFAWSPGGGADEAGQVLTYTVTTLPTGVATVTLADGSLLVAGRSYTLGELQTLHYRLIAGSGTLAFTVSDDGGTANGGQDTLFESLTINVTNVAPVLSGANALATQLEDSPGNGTLVADLVTGRIVDPSGSYGIAVTALSTANGSWEFSTDGGGTWSAFGAVSATNARLLAADAATRVRFVGNANWNGSVANAITFRGWDRTSGTAGGTADASSGGGTSAFSTATASSSLTVTAVNDAPVRTGGTVANLSVNEGATATSLGLGAVNYIAGPVATPFDEIFGGSAQTLTYTVTVVPAGVGTIVLSDNTTVVVAGNSYTLTQLQGMKFVAASGVQAGSGTFGFEVRDNGGTANGGVDTLAQSLTVTVVNRAPTLTGANNLSSGVEDATSSGTLVSDLIAGRASDPANTLGIAVTGVVTTNGNWEYTRDGGTTWSSLNGASATGSILLAADSQTRVRFVPAANWNGTVANGLSFRAWDRSSGTAGGTADTTANGGTTAFSATTASSSVTVAAVNDPPVRTAGTLADLAVPDGAAATSLGLSGLAYGPGGGADEATQTLTYTVTAVPSSLGQVLLANGTVVTAGTSYTLLQIQGMQFRPVGTVTGSATFSFTVRDNGGTGNGGGDSLVQSLTVRVNRAPVLSGANTMAAVYEDFDASGGVPQGNPPSWTPAAQRAGTLVTDLIAGRVTDANTSALTGIAITGTSGTGSWQYTLDGGNNWVAITASDTSALLLPANTQTRVRFLPAADWNGTASLTFRAWDQTAGTIAGRADTTVNGGTSAFSAASATSTLAVLPVNDAPVLISGALVPVTVAEGSPAVTLGLAGIAWGPGGGSDETGQTISIRATAVPASTFGTVLLANGAAVTAGGTYTLAQIQGLTFRPATGAGPGTATFGLVVVDNGGTANGGVDSLAQNLTLTIVNQAPVLTGANAMGTLQEDAGANAGTLVTTLVAGKISDPSGLYGIAVTSVDTSHGSWQYSTNGGTSWSTLAGASDTAARLLAADASTRVRFVPAADWNGTAMLDFVGWDRSSGTAGALGDTSVRGGTSAFSSAAASSSITVSAVNDPPVRTAGTVANLTVAEDSGSTSLGFAALTFGPGGGTDEAGQALTYTITALPPSALGRIVLADGSDVALRSYALTDLQGMRFVTAADAHGSGSFAFVVQDDGGGVADTLTQALTITVTPVNDPPVAHAGTGTVAEGGTLTGTVTFDDVDLPGDTLTLTLVGTPAHGTVVLAADGSYTYTHDGSETASDAFTFRVKDASGATSDATVTLTITPVNDNTPAAQADSGTVLEGGTLTGAVTATDDDSPNDTLTFAKVSDPVYGTLTFNADGTYTYVHDGSENFSDSFMYEVTDAAGHKSQATVTLTITPVNDNTPAAQAGSETVLEGGTLTGAVTATDADAPNDTLTFAKVTDPVHGTLTFNADGTYTYVHDGSENFSDSFAYEVTDAAGHTSQATVTLTITPVNDNTPVAQAATDTLLEGGTLTGAVAATDADAPNDTLTFAKVSDPIYGTLTFNADGTYTYVHDGSNNFSDSFTYEVTDAAGHTSQATVTLTITPVNDNTPAAQAASETVLEGGTLTGSVTATDADSPNDTLTFAKVTDPAHGTLTLNADGTYTYVHDGSENFSDSFAYGVTDAAGHTSQATVTLTITPVNDNTPAAQASSATVLEGGTLTGAVTATDADLPNDALTFAKVSDPAHGTLTFDPDGTYTYVHDGSENFSDSFAYEVTDAAGHTSQATVTLTITPVNDNTPVAQAATGTLLEGGTLIGAVSATDADAPNDTLTFTKGSDPAHGTLTFHADGTYTYVHDGSENFSDSFMYEVTDAGGHKSQATVTLTVTPVNDNTPLAQAGSETVLEGGTLTGAVTATDADSPNDTLTFAKITDPVHGTLTFNADGTYTYVHDGSESFSDSFAYDVTDAAGHISQATVTLTITPVNDNTPVAQAATGTLLEGGTLIGAVSATDADAPNDTLTFTKGSDPAHGTLTFNADGTYTYVHDGSENFSDSFAYAVTDAAGHTSQATVTLTITPVNDNTPAAQAASETVPEGGTLIGAVTATDADSPNDTLAFAKVTDPVHGTLTFNADGTYTYVHDGSENFGDSFTYEVTDAAGHTSQATVTLTITPVNDNTPAAQAASETVLEGGTLTGSVTATDADSPNDTLTFAKVTDPAHGTLTLNADGTYTYVHDGSENFSDSFAYAVTDAAGHTSQATVTLTITPVNDNTPGAQASSQTVLEGGTLTGAVTATDADLPNDALTFAKVSDPVHGTLTFNADGTYTYVHDGSENFSDSFAYEVTDAAGHTSQATVTLTITPVNDNTPVAQAATGTLLEGGTLIGAVSATDADAPNDTLTFTKGSDPAHGTLTFHADGTYTYVHDGSENFSDAFTYEVTDGAGHTSQATVTLTITPVNDNTPVAQAATGTLLEGGTLIGAVSATDADAPNDTLTFTKGSDPAHGTLTFHADGTYTYVHDGSENFSDSFMYEVTDAGGHKSQATVTLTVTPVNDNTPLAQAGSETVLEGGTLTGAVTATDADSPNDTLTFAKVTDPVHGTLTFNADGTYTYVHDGSENFSDSFAYEVTDAAGHTRQATVTLTITPVNDNTPVAQAASETVPEGGTLIGAVTATDADLPNDALMFAKVSDPAHGTLRFNADGTYTYVHDGSENFSDSFAYEVLDAAGHTSQATVTLTITPVNDNTPAAQADSGTVLEGGTLTGAVTATDDDSPNDTLTFAKVSDPVYGTLTFNADGTYTYVHDGSDNFSDSFAYEVTDAAGHTSQATVTLTITPVNDNTPVAQADSGTVLEGGTLTGAVTATDADSPNDTLTFAKVSDPAHGTLTFDPDGTYTYVHDGSENFSDAFTYEVTDAAGHKSQATVTLTVTPVNDNTPLAQAGSETVLEGGTLTGAVTATDADSPNDTLTFAKVTDPAHGTLTLNADGTYTYVHDGSENFSDSFAYGVTDAAGHTSQATVTLTITPVNDNTPAAQADSGTVLEGGTLTGAVTATDDDSPNDTLTFAKVSDPVHGTLTFNADGTYTYVHDGGENFSDSFAYEVTDAAGHTSQATVTLTITPVNDNTPVAQAATGTLLEGGTLIGAVSATDADEPNDTLTFAKVSDPAHGTLTFDPDGTYTYVHDGSENFSDAFTYEVTDAAGHKSQATVTLTVTPVNDNTPLAQAGSETVLEGGTLTGAVTATDADSPNDTLTFAKVTDPVHGTLTFHADGTYTYVHDGSENFSDSFAYEVTDAAGHTSQATVTLTITPVNDNTPAAQAASETVLEGGTLTGSVTATDADSPNDTLTFAKVTDPAHGTLTLNADGTYTYVHDGSENFQRLLRLRGN